MFLPDHKSFGLVGEFASVIIPADANDRFDAEIALLDSAAGVGVKMIWKFSDQIFAFDFHSISSFFININVFTLNVNGVNI